MSDDSIEFLKTLENVIRQRIDSGEQDSYTARLVASGDKRVAQKVGEEALELALASVQGDRSEQIDEAADLVYHLLVLLASKDLCLSDIAVALEDRNHHDESC